MYQNSINLNGYSNMFNLTKKKNRSRKNDGKDGEALYKLINNAIYGKIMENLKI